ncbi:MAG: transposase [Pseudomonadota bacterium]
MINKENVGKMHHIIVRGIDRQKIFKNDEDRNHFLSRLRIILTETKTDCYAWALIPNHFHLLLRTGNISISTTMRRFLRRGTKGFWEMANLFKVFLKLLTSKGK